MARIEAGRLESFVGHLLVKVGVPEDCAEQVAISLVGADLRGHTSHGVLRVPLYLDWLGAGRINPEATPAVEHVNASAVSVDGRLNFGQVVGRVVVDTLVPKTERGVAVAGVKNATHHGRIGEWAERVAERGLLFAAFVNTSGAVPTVAPPGSADRRLSTNPVAFGIPTFDALPFQLVFDAATSQVAHGKIRERAASDAPIPPEWTTNADGDPVRDADAFESGVGALLPLGGRTAGYKGFGLAVVAELFAGLVGDAPVAGESDEGGLNAATFAAIDPLAFTTRTDAKARVEALAKHLRSAEQHEEIPVGIGAKGDETLLPGEAEHRQLAQRRKVGIPLPPRVVDSLRDLAAEHDVEVPPFAE